MNDEIRPLAASSGVDSFARCSSALERALNPTVMHHHRETHDREQQEREGQGRDGQGRGGQGRGGQGREQERRKGQDRGLEPQELERQSATSARRLRRWGLWFFLAVLCAGSVLLSTRLEPHDDAYISFRYAENLANGRGLVFNVGEAVEGYSTPSFVLLLALGKAVGFTPAMSASLLNASALFVLLLVAWQWARELSALAKSDVEGRAGGDAEPEAYSRTHGRTHGPTHGSKNNRSGSLGDLLPSVAAGIACAVVLLHPGTLYYLTSGMETVFFCALVASAAFLSRRPARSLGKALALGTVLAALAVTRPEGAGLAALLVLLAIWDGVSSRLSRNGRVLRGGRDDSTQRGEGNSVSGLGAAALTALLPALAMIALFCTRWLIFGDLAPNTYYAKIGPWDLRRLTRGIEYLLDAAPWIALPLVLSPLVRLPWRRTLLVALLPLAYFSAFAVYAGGDWMDGQRMLLPGLISAALVMGLVGKALRERVAEASRAVQLVAAAGVALLLAACALAQLHTIRLMVSNSKVVHSYRLLGERLASEPKGLTIAMGGVGVVAYSSDRTVIDAFGLTDEEIARHGHWAAANTVGHQRYDGSSIWRRQPDLVFPLNGTSPEPLSETELLDRIEAGDPNRFWVRELREQPGFAQRYRYDTVRLSDGQVVGFYRREGAAASALP